jgi:nucleoside 2-deoxyribosyltransferase
MYSDSGTAWECGYAYGIGKTVRMLCQELDGNFDFSLMMINGCEEHDWILNYLYNTDVFSHQLIQK